MSKSRVIASFFFIAATLGALPVSALTLVPQDQGTIHESHSRSTGRFTHDPSSTDLLVFRRYTGSAGAASRGYALFSIPSSPLSFGSAVLHLNANVDAPNYPGTTPLQVWDVTTPPSFFDRAFTSGGSLINRTWPERAAYLDLGEGVAYASASLDTGASTPSLTLSAGALAALNAARGGIFAIGLTGPSSFRMTLDGLQLQLTPVPEPSSAVLLLAGCAGIVAWRHGSRNGGVA